MLALLGSRLGIKMIFGLAVVAAMAGGVLWVKTLRDDLAQAIENTAFARAAVEEQRQTALEAAANAESWREAHDLLLARSEILQRNQREASAELDRLRRTFTRHNLGALARGRPGLVTGIVRRGSRDLVGVLECVTAGDHPCSSGPSRTTGETSSPASGAAEPQPVPR